jgi:hypothetical protein
MDPNSLGYSRLAILSLNGGDVELRFAGTLRLQLCLGLTHSLVLPIARDAIQTNTAGSTGQLVFTNTPSGDVGFYRTGSVSEPRGS